MPILLLCKVVRDSQTWNACLTNDDGKSSRPITLTSGTCKALEQALREVN